MHPILFKIGNFTIPTYGVFVFLGVISAYLLSIKEAKRCGLNDEKFSDLVFWSIIFGFVGARVLYIFVEWQWFIHDPWAIILSRSGFVFYGGVIGSSAAFYIVSKRKGIGFLKAADIAALYIPLAHALGRIGCFFYGCCYGKVTKNWCGFKFSANSPAGMLGDVKLIPTQLISSLALCLIFVLLRVCYDNKKNDGVILFLYILSYSIFRFLIEFIRFDYRGVLFGLSTSQFIAIVMVLLSLFLIRTVKGRDE